MTLAKIDRVRDNLCTAIKEIDMTPEELNVLFAVQVAKNALLSSINRCEIAGLSDMNVVQPLRDALAAVIGVRNVIEGKV